MSPTATTKPPVILQVLPALHTGGVERGTVEISGALAREGWQSVVASAGGELVRQLSYTGATHVELPLASKNPLTIWRNASQLQQIITKYGVNLVHARSRAPAWSALLACRSTGVPLVTTFHGVYGLENTLKKHYNAVMTRGRLVIAVSNYIAEHIRANYNVPAERIRIIPRGVDIDAFNINAISQHRLFELVERWRIPDDVPIIALPGRVTRWKGHHVLLDALALLPHRDFFCLFIGDDTAHPNYRKELGDRIKTLGLGDKVRFTGNTTAMAEAYTLCNLVIVTSIEPEAFGRVPIEAQIMGKPVIAAAHGGAIDTVLPQETGWLVEPDSAESMADALIEALAADNDLLEVMGRRGQEHVSANFSLHKMCDRTLNTYEELLQQTR